MFAIVPLEGDRVQRRRIVKDSGTGPGTARSGLAGPGEGGVMAGSVLQAAAALRRALAGFEPGVFNGLDCATLADELATTEKACSAARLLAAARAAECGAHKERGYADPAQWLARQGGTTPRQAKDALAAAGKLGRLSDTKAALLSGE